VLFVVLKGKMRRFGQPKTDTPALNKRVDRMVGQTVITQSDLSLSAPSGSAKSNDDTIWQVRLTSNIASQENLPAGSHLKVIATDGGVLLVETL
jgi:membrane protein implicated in regulation of membrane protease activity